jgi:hypothetical protein
MVSLGFVLMNLRMLRAISWPSMGALVLARDFPIVRKDFACGNDVSFVSKITGPLRKGQVAIHP